MEVNILVEGQTEETFIKDVLNPYLNQFDIYAKPIIVTTKVLANGSKYRGGLSNFNWKYFETDLQKILNSTPHGLVTTFIDYYAIPSKFPGYENRLNYTTADERVDYLENQLKNKYGNPDNFIPYIQLHEFEAMLFADKCGFKNCIVNDNAINKLLQIIDDNPFPEAINDGAHTAPSKRILNCYEEYDKIIEGNFILLEIGLDVVMEKCPRLKQWIEKIILYYKTTVKS